ncbi:S1-C subfamily serine protease [Stenotrophomonas rhizophila]|uniref:S1-C subfamily serine protease n=1 Tax=Stenotrophomonas rhizophila TaxID=216778 RepID=A0AAP5EB99_9GAMM|nr:S1-C subfamily serine protease [Stenotrophomonas rhizophila]
MRPLPTLLTLALAAAFGGFVASAINAHLDNRAEAAPATLAIPATAALPASVAGQPVPSLAPMLERVMPAVVSVNTKQVVRVRNPYFNDPFFRRLFPEVPQERINESLGSGVIIDAAEGLVLTNHHVIENADDVQVTLSDGRTVKAEFLGSDRDTDIALIRIPADKLTALPLGDSTQLRVGDFVVAIGNPFGFSQTVTSGIVSAVGRTGIRGLGYQNFIQTDASINPGNSGGALVNLQGQLVGINTASFNPQGSMAGNIGLGLAIPTNLARDVVDQLIKHGRGGARHVGHRSTEPHPGAGAEPGPERSAWRACHPRAGRFGRRCGGAEAGRCGGVGQWPAGGWRGGAAQRGGPAAGGQRADTGGAP